MTLNEAPPKTLHEAKERGRALRRSLDKVLTRVVEGDIQDVLTLEVCLKEVEAEHEWVTFQDVLGLVVPRLRALMAVGPRPFRFINLKSSPIKKDVRNYLRVDELVKA